MLGEAAGSSRWPLLHWSCRYHVMYGTGINACARLVALSHPVFFLVFESFREIDSTYMLVGVCPTTPETAPWLEAASVLRSLVALLLRGTSNIRFVFGSSFLDNCFRSFVLSYS